MEVIGKLKTNFSTYYLSITIEQENGDVIKILSSKQNWQKLIEK